MAESIVVQPNVASRGSAFTDSFFQQLPVDLRYLRTVYQQVLPTNSIQNMDTIEFRLEAWHNNTFYLLDKILMVAQLSLTKEDGSVIGQTHTEIGIINMPLHSIIKDLRVHLNDEHINPAVGNHNYKQYIETVLSNSPEFKYSARQNAGYYPDTAGDMSSLFRNAGFQQRANLFRKIISPRDETKNPPIRGLFDYTGEDRHKPTFCDYLPLDLTGTPPIVNGVTVRFGFTLAPSSFVIMQEHADPKHCRYKVEHIYLRVPSVIVEPSAYESIQSMLNESKLINYSFRRRTVKHMIVPKNTLTWTSETLFAAASAPSRLVVTMVTEEAFHGQYTANPYEFIGHAHSDNNNFRVRSVNLTLNGENVDGLPSDEPAVWFHKLYQYTGLRDHKATNGISLHDFMNGYFFVTYDLSTSLNASTISISPAVRSGFLRLQLEFAETLAENYVVLIWAEFPALVTVDVNRIVNTNYLQGGYSR